MRFDRSRPLIALAAALVVSGCATGPSLQQRRVDAKQAIDALQAGKFDKAQQEAGKVIGADRKNPFAHVVAGITRYKKAMHQLSTDVRTVVFGSFRAGGFNHRYMRSSLEQTKRELALVDQDLAAAAVEGIDLEICLACWEVDWNHNGRIDDADRWVFQIERDEKGERIPKDDPRRKPTFRFDVGDVAWARAFVSFQRAALDILLAYKWTELSKIFVAFRGQKPTIRIRMTKPELVKEARQRILEGLGHADQARRAYLSEKDDDREWIPNPKQKSHPMPLPVDDNLYKTWELVIGDIKRLVSGDEGLSVEAVAQLGDHQWQNPPGGFIDIGKMLDQPKDIVFHVGELMQLQRAKDVEGALRSILGDYYVPKMKASPITGRLDRMKKEIRRGEESLERKLRYLFWLN